MAISDELLTRYVDGELNESDRALVEAAALDPAVAMRLESHRTLRRRLAGAFASVLEEPVPPTLTGRFAEDRRGATIDLAEAREARKAKRRLPAWAQASAMAACLAAGLFVGAEFIEARPEPQITGDPGGLQAHGELAIALEHRLAAAPPAGHIVMGVSFVSNDGRYCRTFSASVADGLACRESEGWRVRMLVEPARPPADARTYRQAATTIAAPILEAVEGTMRDVPLDANQEADAQAAGWRLRSSK